MEYGLLAELLNLAERGLDGLEDEIALGVDVSSDEIISATETLRAAQGLL